ncbi:hypothetical protein FSP39_014467 [Pinctada imbricata]|uniref:26S proteasome non-ATPase regulatory subunit 5 n=1 Tax=Pinctada imbricata TaxID=66713 RepID=A0AA88XLK6_PINIB|nr:hypothetical protein FSP39_014467 [Pinctada imbricata]
MTKQQSEELSNGDTFRKDLHEKIVMDIPESCFSLIMEKRRMKIKEVDNCVLPISVIAAQAELQSEEIQNAETLLKKIQVNEDQVLQLKNATKDQAHSELWKEHRKARLTASNFKRICTRVVTLRKDQTASSAALVHSLMGYKEVRPTKAMKHGTTLEPVGKKAYVQEMKKIHKNFKAAESGLTLYTSKPFIGASADLEVKCDCCDEGLCEIKCPETIKNAKPCEENLTYISNGTLNENHQYFFQLTSVCEAASDELVPQDSLVEKIVQLFADGSLEVAQQVGKFVLVLSKSSSGLCLLYNNAITSTLQQVMNINDTIRFRVYETLINVAKQSLAALEQTHHSGLIQQLLNEVHKDDILVQLNTIELLSDLTMCDHGLVYLDQQGIVGKLESMMQNLDTDPMAGLLLPGLMKFFGGVARFHPKEVCGENQVFVRNVFTSLSSPDTSLRNVAVQTVGFIGTMAEGKMALEKLGNVMDEGVRDIGSVIRNSPSELRIQGLNTAATLVRVEVEDQTTELCSLTEKWFKLLDRKPFDAIMSVAQQPFEDLRSAAHCVFSSLAMQTWGQKMMTEWPGFTEYLLDRSTEKAKETKESKFDIVRTLANSPTCQEIFGQPSYVKLKAHFMQGPFFVQVQSEVAFEGD